MIAEGSSKMYFT